VNAHKGNTEQRAPALDVTGMTEHADEAGALLKAMASTWCCVSSPQASVRSENY